MAVGEINIEVTFSKLALHFIAMAVGWIGLLWFIQRKKLGVYASIASHALGLIAVMTQTPEMLDNFPPAFIAIFFVILFIITLGPLFKYKEEFA